HIHGLDLRHAPSVEIFARHVDQAHHRLDILINNAAQTVRRPPGFYAHLLEGELGIHSSGALSLLPYALEQEGDNQALFPQGRLDADLQQVDLRQMNSWRMK